MQGYLSFDKIFEETKFQLMGRQNGVWGGGNPGFGVAVVPPYDPYQIMSLKDREVLEERKYFSWIFIILEATWKRRPMIEDPM